MVGGSANYVGPSDPVSNSDDVILIESDDEQHSSRDSGLRSSTTRDTMSPNSNGSNQSEVVSRESSRNADSVSPMGSTAEYIDLEMEPAENEEQDDMIVYDERLSTPRDAEDDELIFVQEQTRPSTIQLNLPGRNPMRITATEYDRPARRSFEQQASNRQLRHQTRVARRQPMRRAARRANHSMNGYESDDGGLASNRNQINHDPEFAAMQRRLDSYPLDIRSAFLHAQNMNEFSSIIENVDPLTWQDCRYDLERLFMDYRRMMARRAAQIGQNMPGYRSPPNRTQGNADLLRRLGPLGVRIGIGTGMGESLTHYILEPGIFGYGSFRMIGNPGGFDDGMEEEARTQSILNAIQEREEQERDAQTKSNMEKTRSQEENFIEKCKNLPEGYSASFDTTPTTVRLEPLNDGNKQAIVVEDESAIAEWEEIAVCCLCGVELGVGLPDDFTGISADDRHLSFDELVTKYCSHCPYQSLTSANGTERALSMKTFVASCGHTFCGRCVVRIENARTHSKSSKKELSKFKGPLHPDNYGPRLCPATGCKQNIRLGRTKMREAFF